jgi:phenylpyruvate tautomerase PptA (4-oxalocrotonate tautomerase family)
MARLLGIHYNDVIGSILDAALRNTNLYHMRVAVIFNEPSQDRYHAMGEAKAALW